MTVIRYCLRKHRQLLIDTFYYKARCQTLLLSRLRNNIRCVKIIIPTCKNLMQGGEKNPVQPINHPHKVGFKFALVCFKLQLDSNCCCWCCQEKQLETEGDGDGDRVPACFLSRIDGQRDGSGRTEVAKDLHVESKGRGYICFCLSRRDFFFSSPQV